MTFISSSPFFERAKVIISVLKNNGYLAYFVGGCVRDMMLGIEPKDFDVCTDATPNQILPLFPNSKLVGEKFGVVIVNGVDVATFRIDDSYSDGRRPDSVKFAKTPQEDSSRRDFTINALYFDPTTDEILDFYDGLSDIKNKSIKTVGNPYERFAQDHLRILRADRFAAKFDFTIEQFTFEAMKDTAPYLANIDAERIVQELMGSLMYNSYRTVGNMYSTKTLDVIFPETVKYILDILPLLSATKDKFKKAEFSFAILFCRLSLEEIEVVSKRLKFSNELKEYILDVIKVQFELVEFSEYADLSTIKKIIRKKNFNDAFELFRLKIETGILNSCKSTYDLLLENYLQLDYFQLNPSPFITGVDLINFGYKPGVLFKIILNDIENKQLNGEISNKEAAVLYVLQTYELL